MGNSMELMNLKFDHIHFTGSPLHGKSVMKKASENLTSVTLELGGKSPAIIDDTANLKATADNFLFGKFVNCGQTCIAVDYVLIDETIKPKFIASWIKWLKQFYTEHPESGTPLEWGWNWGKEYTYGDFKINYIYVIVTMLLFPLVTYLLYLVAKQFKKAE